MSAYCVISFGRNMVSTSVHVSVFNHLQTGDQFGDDSGATSSSTVSLTEFLQQYTELSQWLAKVDARRLRPAASSARVEKYRDQGFAEELLQRTPRKKLLHEYAQALLERHPEITTEIGEQLAHLDAQWEAAERQCAGLSADVDEKHLAQVLTDISDDVDDFEAWHRDLVKGLPNSNEWLQMMARLSRREVKERLNSLQARQTDIESRSRGITHVLKLIDKLREVELQPVLSPEQSSVVSDLHSVAKRLEGSYHAAWLQSLELLYSTEQFLASPGLSCAAPVEGSIDVECQHQTDPCSLSGLVVGSWGKESGFESDHRARTTRADSTGRGTEASSSAATEQTFPTSESPSLDILPFSEDEYEKIVVPPGASGSSKEVQDERNHRPSVPMRYKSHELMDDTASAAITSAGTGSGSVDRSAAKAEADSTFLRLQQRALYSADLCYEEADSTAGLSRGATLHRRINRETVVRRQSASGRLPCPAGDGAGQSVFLSETELCSTEWYSSDTSDLFGPISCSAEVLMRPGAGEEGDEHALEVSQVHAVLSVTPKKAYYRMTALDNELANESTFRPSAGAASSAAQSSASPDHEEDTTAAESTPPAFDAGESRSPLLDIALLPHLATIGEEDSEARSTASRPTPPLLTSSPFLSSGQKRRYSKSACVSDGASLLPPRAGHQRRARRDDFLQLSPVAPVWLQSHHYSDDAEGEDEEEEETGEAHTVHVFGATSGHGRHGALLERSASESSVIDAANRSSSWRELINQLERDVRHNSGSGGLLIQPAGVGADDDAGSLADESASSGGDASVPRSGANLASAPTGVSSAAAAVGGGFAVGINATGTTSGRNYGGRVRRLRRKATSMQLAEQAELIVRAQQSDHDSPVSEADIDEPSHGCTVAEDSLDQAWDNYQPMYPSACEDDDEAEEKLDLCWDEQLEPTMDTSLAARAQDRLQRRRGIPLEVSDSGGSNRIEDLIARSSLLLERARYSRAVPPSADRMSYPLRGSVTACDSHDGAESTELEREVIRQGQWLAACDSNLNCLDDLKESLTDSGVEDDLEPIRQQVEHLLKQWTAFKEETLGRLELIEGLHKIHVEANIIKQDAQRLADLLDAPTEQLFMDCSQLDKFISTLEFYESHLPRWQMSVDEMRCTLSCSMEQERVDYLDVRKCYMENLHLLGQWLYSLHTRTTTGLTKSGELRLSYETLIAALHACDEALNSEEHILRCTRLAVDIMNYDERDTALRELQDINDRLENIMAQVNACEQDAAVLSHAFIPDHWQHVDSRLTGLGARLISLKDNCHTLKDTIARRPNNRLPLSAPVTAVHKPSRSTSVSPKIRRRITRSVSGVNDDGSGASGEVARRAVNTWRGRRLWRYLRASLPYQFALLVLFGCVYYLLADQDCSSTRRINNLLFSPQVRQAFGSPY